MRWLPVALVLVLLAGCGGGGSDDSGGGDGGRAERLDLLLDFFPNADHAGIYAADASGAFRRRGLDVRIHAPSDPSAPLKLLAAGKADLAVSYEPEVLRARDKGAPVVAVAALVRTPLTSIVSLPRAGIRTPADLRGKTVGTAGIDYQHAYLQAVAPPGVKQLGVGFDLVPALVSGKVDAVLGAYWNYEAIQLRQKGRDPRVIRIEQAGVPTYDELVIAANERDVGEHPERIRNFLAGLAEGTAELRKHPGDALLKANPDLDPGLQRASVRATLPYLEPAAGRPYGYMDAREWRAFTGFLHARKLLKLSSPAGAFTNALLPSAHP
ncbi:MAG: putative hydroxymethylpyrimidine transport system substrate-binding protein [Thermoleophilaceae bacterium]|nr:putative hydroxymethylpyrimidine transport system substrate-binding protein [Thermoleophilaceae bacterium]